jgi:hypothetical protein
MDASNLGTRVAQDFCNVSLYDDTQRRRNTDLEALV